MLTLNEVGEWECYRSQWEALLNADPSQTVFQSYDWAVAYRKIYGANAETRLLVGKDGTGNVRCILPLIVRSLSRVIKELMPIGGDYLDMVCAPEDRSESIKALYSYLATQRGNWNFADFRSLRAEGVLASATDTHLAEKEAKLRVRKDVPACLRAMAMPHQRYPFVPLPDTWQGYEQGLAKKFAWQLAYDKRHFFREHSEASLRLANTETLSDDLHMLFDLHQAEWTARGELGAFGSERDRQFHCELAHRFVKTGTLVLLTLRAGSEPVAALYCFRQGNSLVYYQGGFSNKFCKYSPGKMLIAEAIKHAISTGATEFDFLKGDEDSKHRWQPACRTTWRLMIAPRYSPGVLLMKGYANAPEVRAFFRRIRGKTG